MGSFLPAILRNALGYTRSIRAPCPHGSWSEVEIRKGNLFVLYFWRGRASEPDSLWLYLHQDAQAPLICAHLNCVQRVCIIDTTQVCVDYYRIYYSLSKSEEPPHYLDVQTTKSSSHYLAIAPSAILIEVTLTGPAAT
jgi:hypothetical protein